MIETSLSQSEPMTLPERPRGGALPGVAAHSLLTAALVVLPMPVFVPAMLLHCGIRHGRRAAWATLAGAFAFSALYVTAASLLRLNIGVTRLDVAMTLLAVALPALLVLPLVERAQNLGRVLVFMLIASAAGLLVLEFAWRELFAVSPFAEQVEQIRRMNRLKLEAARPNGVTASEAAFAGKIEAFFVSIVPASALIGTSVFFVFSLLMLGRLKAWRDLAAQRGDATAAGAYLFRNFAMPDWVLFAFVAGGIAPLLTGVLQKIAGNVLVLVAFLYVIQGLAILRFMLAAVGIGLLGTLFGMVFIGLPTSPLLGLAGLFDPFFDFRHFKKRKDDSNESHSD